MSSQKLLVTTPVEREIHSERTFNAPRKLVYDTFSDPSLISEWWGPRAFSTRVVKMDFQVGGEWRFVHTLPDGSKTGFQGVYKEITPPESVVQTFEWDGLPGHVIVETAYFEEVDENTTRIRNISRFESNEDRDGMIQSGMESGLNESYERFEELLARISG